MSAFSSDRRSVWFAAAIIAALLFFAPVARAAMIQQWVALYSTRADDNEGFDVAIDAAGDTVVTGTSFGSANVFLAKYDPDGATIWDTEWDGPTGEDDGAYSLALDAGGNIYVAADTIFQGNTRAVLLKYDRDGEL